MYSQKVRNPTSARRAFPLSIATYEVLRILVKRKCRQDAVNWRAQR